MSFLAPATAGLLTGAGLIIAIGAQNVFLLRQGIRREHVAPVVAVCALSDVVLITAGVAGAGVLVAGNPIVATMARWLGGLYLLGFAALAARRMRRPAALSAVSGAASSTRWATVGAALALTWLNPHVYLDTLLTLGGIAASNGPQAKWYFAAGACLASIVWFCSVGFGSRLLAPLFSRARVWQILDGVVAATMSALGVGLIVSAVG